MARAVTSRLRPPNGYLDAVVQIGMWFAAYYLYRLVRGLVDGQVAVSFAHARSIVDFERSLGLFFEPGLQHVVNDHLHPLIEITNVCYVNMHLFGTTAFLLWLYFARNEAFYFVRNMFMVAMGIALIGYVVFPTAPPRFLPEWGFTDTVTQMVGSEPANTANVLYNPYAAVPSMHVAFALMLGFAGARLVKTRVLKVLFYGYPLWVAMVTILTANHFWMDAFLGALTAAASFWAASYALARARPHAWAFRRTLGSEAPA
jgi:membrane-associated phospholipid phosphatase